MAANKLNILNQGQPAAPLISQPPHDRVLGNASMYHYTWGTLYKASAVLLQELAWGRAMCGVLPLGLGNCRGCVGGRCAYRATEQPCGLCFVRGTSEGRMPSRLPLLERWVCHLRRACLLAGPQKPGVEKEFWIFDKRTYTAYEHQLKAGRVLYCAAGGARGAAAHSHG